MLVLDRPADLKDHVGADLPPSGWLTVDQAMIDAFADATGDHQWIHVDVKRAAREMPGGKTIAHGYLVLALLARLIPEVYTVRDRRLSLNYGSNRVRFTNPVPAGARLRLHLRFAAAEDTRDGGVRVIQACTVEIEGEEKPALVAEVISVSYPAQSSANTER